MSDDIQQILEDAGRLAALEASQLVDSPVDESFDRLTRLASKILGVPVSMVSLVEPSRQFIKSQVGLDEPIASERETPISHSFCKYVVATGKPLIIEDAREHPLVRDNPSIRDLEVISYLGIPLVSPDGWHLGSFCVIDHKPHAWTQDDVETMQTLAESVSSEINLRMEARAKEVALVELQTRNQELDAFAHTVSHNLKNPISAIIGWASLSTIYGDNMPFEELLDTIDKMGDIASQTNEIINALLLLATVSRSEEIPRQKLNMYNIVDDALARLEHELTSSDCKVLLPPAHTFPYCLGYRPWVEEVWINYITNALKYGGNPPEIEFGAEQSGENQVRYWIKDNGKGLLPEEQAKLFIPFSRLPQASKIEGHGLGLSIVQRIIEKLDGEVGITSEVGIGSAFSFTLPTSFS